MKNNNNIASESNSKNSLPTFLSLLCKMEKNGNTGKVERYLFQDIVENGLELDQIAYDRGFNSDEYGEHDIIITYNKKVIKTLLDDKSSFLKDNLYLTISGNFSNHYGDKFKNLTNKHTF